MPAPDAKPDSESAKTIAALNQKADGWVFEVPSYQVAALTKSMSELTKKPDAKASAHPTVPQGAPPGMPPGFPK
jgi:hypothetical protein